MQTAIQVNRPYDWSFLPDGIQNEIFYKNADIFSLIDKIRCSWVCKHWHNIVQKNEFGEKDLKSYNLRQPVEFSWIKVISIYFKNPINEIAVDISGSMQKYSEMAISIAMESVEKIRNLDFIGVDCIVSGTKIKKERLFSKSDIEKFFKKDHDIHRGTNLSLLFKEIYKEIYKGNSKERHLKNTTVISDFSDEYQNIFLPEHEENYVTLDCHRLKDDEDRNGDSFQNKLQYDLRMKRTLALKKAVTKAQKRKFEDMNPDKCYFKIYYDEPADDDVVHNNKKQKL